METRASLGLGEYALDDVDTVRTYARDLGVFLNENELTERRTTPRASSRTIVVKPGMAAIVYSIPTWRTLPSGERTPPRSPSAGEYAVQYAVVDRSVLYCELSAGWSHCRPEEPNRPVGPTKPNPRLS